jgi:hypothetical protein
MLSESTRCELWACARKRARVQCARDQFKALAWVPYTPWVVRVDHRRTLTACHPSRNLNSAAAVEMTQHNSNHQQCDAPMGMSAS